MKQKKKLLTQTEIANKIGISKGNLSKWIKKENVSPIKEIGNKKLFDETLIEQYKKAHKLSEINKSKSFSMVEFLQEQLEKKQEENNDLKDRIKQLEEQLKGQNDEIIKLAHNFAKLADQAQQLNLADKQIGKKEIESEGTNVAVDSNETKHETETFWKKIFKR